MCQVTSSNKKMHGTNDITPTTVIPKDRDILCAHRKFCYKHQGNVRFRIMIATQLPTYIDPQTTRKERASIIDTILEELCQDGCSFLRKGTDGWFELSKKEAREKVAHSMRDARGEMKRYVLKKNALNARRERNSDAAEAKDLDEDENNVADFLAKQASERTITTEEEESREEEMRENSDEDITHTDSSQEFQQYTANEYTANDASSSSQQFQSDYFDAASPQEFEQQTITNFDGNKGGINPTVKDILCGQGKICYDHVGNQNFRKIIDLNLPKYLDPKRSKSEKTAIIENITEWIYDEGCSFLRESSEGWVVLSKHEGREKVAHALRDAKFVLKRRESKSPTVLSDDPPVTSDYNFLQRDANMTDITALATGINILNSMGGENRSSEIRFIENAILMGRKDSGVLAREYEKDVSTETLQTRSANVYNAMLNEGNGGEITTCDYHDFVAPQPPNITADILSNDNNSSIASLHTVNDANYHNANGSIGLKPVFGCVVFSQ